ncbi:MAG: hypothetical protein L3K25_11475 [Gammaproteobacteria bacterium]|nr:hypothetical protein [Gammaproteobacteria bacterium]
MLELGDLLNLIRLTELEIRSLKAEIESDNEEAKNNAGEIIVQFDELSVKLRKMYEEARPDDSDLPEYEEYMEVVARK